jgi:hypothetical protein
MTTTTSVASSVHFDVWFESLFNHGRSLVFPCDETGRVEIDALGERERNNYFLARATLGRDYATPRVVRRGPIPHCTLKFLFYTLRP